MKTASIAAFALLSFTAARKLPDSDASNPFPLHYQDLPTSFSAATGDSGSAMPDNTDQIPNSTGFNKESSIESAFLPSNPPSLGFPTTAGAPPIPFSSPILPPVPYGDEEEEDCEDEGTCCSIYYYGRRRRLHRSG